MVLDQPSLSRTVGCRDYNGRTALHIAAARGSLKVIDYLLSCRADVNAIDMCAPGWQTPTSLSALPCGLRRSTSHT